MGRSHLREDQVLDVDFVSEEEHTFISLSDVTTYSGQGGKNLVVKYDESGIDYIAATGSNIYNFINLYDTPTTYSGYGDTSHFVKIKSDATGLEFAPAMTGTTSSGVPSGSMLWFNSDPEWNTFFLYDPNREKWLSVMRHTYLFAYAGAGSGQYMSIGNVTHSSAYYYVPRNGTITGIMASSEHAQNPSKIFQLYDGVTTISGGLFQCSNWEYTDLAADINIDAGTELKLHIISDGSVVRNPIVTIEVAWRFDV